MHGIGIALMLMKIIPFSPLTNQGDCFDGVGGGKGEGAPMDS